MACCQGCSSGEACDGGGTASSGITTTWNDLPGMMMPSMGQADGLLVPYDPSVLSGDLTPLGGCGADMVEIVNPDGSTQCVYPFQAEGTGVIPSPPETNRGAWWLLLLVAIIAWSITRD